jgi:uncharacterized protein (DUF58 family)
MIPRLANRGKLVVASVLLFLVVGAIHGSPPLVGIAGVALAALLAAHVGFYPTAILLRHKKIELAWWVPPGDQPGGVVSVDRPFFLHIAFRNHGGRTLRILRARVLASDALEIADDATATVAAGCQVEVRVSTRARAAGYQVFHGVVVELGDLLGLFDVEAYFPSSVAVNVFPRTIAARNRVARNLGGSSEDHVGPHPVRRRGSSGELREIRDHQHGDPFKFIAWKATAKRRKLMVRELETELIATHMLVVDIGAGMRHGELGKTALDWALDCAAALAREAMDRGDRVGLVAFDTRRCLELAPDTGRDHWMRLVDRLLEARSIVDEDLTDITSGELVAVIARYLAHQESFDIRLRVTPPLDDPRWVNIQAGPDGQLYDLAAAQQLIEKLLAAAQQLRWRGQLAAALAQSGKGDVMSLLRFFCRWRGVELPYAEEPEHGRRCAGFAEALAYASRDSGADSIVILSDLEGLHERPAVTQKTLGLARRHTRKLTVLCPAPRRFLPTSPAEAADVVRRIVVRDSERRQEPARTLFARRGVTIVDAGPGDHPDRLLARRGKAA